MGGDGLVCIPLNNWVLGTASSESVEVNFTPRMLLRMTRNKRDLFLLFYWHFKGMILSILKKRGGKCLVYIVNL